MLGVIVAGSIAVIASDPIIGASIIGASIIGASVWRPVILASHERRLRGCFSTMVVLQSRPAGGAGRACAGVCQLVRATADDVTE
jgi:hypothetical protein